MGTNELDTLNQQRKRRKRINRMKQTIVFVIVFCMLGSFLAIIFP